MQICHFIGVVLTGTPPAPRFLRGGQASTPLRRA